MTKSDYNKETDPQKFPSFNLMAAHTDKEISISEKELKAQKFIVYTYPKDLTSGCTKETNEFSNNLDFFTANDIDIYGLSKDSIKSHLKFIDKEKIPFPLISDPDCFALQLPNRLMNIPLFVRHDAYVQWKYHSIHQSS